MRRAARITSLMKLNSHDCNYCCSFRTKKWWCCIRTYSFLLLCCCCDYGSVDMIVNSRTKSRKVQRTKNSHMHVLFCFFLQLPRRAIQESKQKSTLTPVANFPTFFRLLSLDCGRKLELTGTELQPSLRMEHTTFLPWSFSLYVVLMYISPAWDKERHSILVSLHSYPPLYRFSLIPAQCISACRMMFKAQRLLCSKGLKKNDCWHLQGSDRLRSPASISHIVWKTQDEKAQACSLYSTHSSATSLTSQEAF